MQLTVVIIMKSTFFWTLSLLFLLSCSPGKVYEKHVKMENLAWNRFNVITFDVPIENAGAEYDIFVAIRHITDVPYRKLDVGVYMTAPGGETRSRDLSVRLKDNDGKNLGEGMGDLWDISVPVWKGLKFGEPGTCRIEVNSGMSQLDAIGIMEVGLIVKKSR